MRCTSGAAGAARRADGVGPLRAIPWQFAWTQTRLLLASWLGAEEILHLDANDREMCRVMYRAWPFFRSTVDLLQMVLAKADADIAAHYDRQLVPPDLQGFGLGLRPACSRRSMVCCW